jgi:hypothetical protein
MISPENVKLILTQAVDYLDVGETIAAGVDPALIPFIAIGKAVESQIPGIAASITAWIEGNDPTSAEIDEHAKRLAVLSDPNAP